MDEEQRRHETFEQRDDIDHDAGSVRFTEGYKAEKQSIGAHGTGKSTLATVMYDEKQAVTALEWNPNLDCAGWAAAGMGSGLLRIEDVMI